MNEVRLSGRLVADPEIKKTTGEKPITIARYTLAVDRKYKKEGGQNADFARCVAFGKTAEFAEKYLRKGIKIIIGGSLQTGSYTDADGKTVYTTDVVIEWHEFCESKKTSGNDAPNIPTPNDTSFSVPVSAPPISYDSDEELPF